MRCGLQLRLCRVCLGRYPPKTATRSYDAFLANRLGRTLSCVNVGSKPWYRDGCTDDTPCRFGDAGSMTLLPWFVPHIEPPVQLSDVRPDRGHLLTESCSDA